MMSRIDEVAVTGSSFRPLPPPIPEATFESAVEPQSAVFDPPEVLIVPASDDAPDAPATAPILPDRMTSRQRAAAWIQAQGGDVEAYVPDDDDSTKAMLRSDPPPVLMYTAWLRFMLVVMLFGALGSALWFRYDSATGDVAEAQWVVGLHAGVIGALIVWSFVSMRNADSLMPATRYQSRSRGWVAASLWVLASAAPIGAAVVFDAVRNLFDDPDHPNLVFVKIAIGFVVAAILWLPFRYLAVQASRIGAPRRVMFEWFWMPTLAVGGGLMIMALGLRSDLEADGLTADERLLEAGVLYGLPMLLFALTAWRATAAFDSVIGLRWRTWKTGWDQSVAAFGVADDDDR